MILSFAIARPNFFIVRLNVLMRCRISRDGVLGTMVADLAQEALDIMREAADKYAATGVADHEAMTMAQMKSGLTMQLLNHSRAASGAEHLMAHLVEMHPPRFEGAES